MGALAQGAPKADKVHFFALYETLCPDCIRLLLNQIKPTMDLLHDIIDLEMVPYSKASGSGGHYQCQHGTAECEGNKVHACAAKYVSNQHTLSDYTACMIRDNYDYLGVAEKCAGEFGIDFATIKQCYQEEGNALFEQMGDITRKYNGGSLSYVPTVGINGQKNSYAEDHMKQAICDAYQGTHPNC